MYNSTQDFNIIKLQRLVNAPISNNIQYELHTNSNFEALKYNDKNASKQASTNVGLKRDFTAS